MRLFSSCVAVALDYPLDCFDGELALDDRFGKWNDQCGAGLDWHRSDLLPQRRSLGNLLVILVKVWRSFPFMMLSLLAALQAVNREMYEAGAIDGATSWQQFRYRVNVDANFDRFVDFDDDFQCQRF